jgi:hypothetical protein
MTLQTVIIRDNRIHHLLPASAFDNIKDTKCTDKSLRIYLKSRDWIDAFIAEQTAFDANNPELHLTPCERIVLSVVTEHVQPLTAIQKATGYTYHVAKNAMYKLRQLGIVESICQKGWRLPQ